jgi:hypothetical protein
LLNLHPQVSLVLVSGKTYTALLALLTSALLLELELAPTPEPGTYLVSKLAGLPDINPIFINRGILL